MMITQGSGGSPSPVHRHRNPTVRLDRPRVPPATPRSTVAPPSVRDHEESMTAVSASPADPPTMSSAGTVAPLLPVSLAKGGHLSARVGGSGSRPRSWATRELVGRALGEPAQ
jgi:hypothetical protein